MSIYDAKARIIRENTERFLSETMRDPDSATRSADFQDGYRKGFSEAMLAVYWLKPQGPDTDCLIVGCRYQDGSDVCRRCGLERPDTSRLRGKSPIQSLMER